MDGKIRTDAELAEACAEAHALWDASPGTTAGDRLDALLAMVDEYENPSLPATPRARDAAETGGNLRPASRADIDIARWVSERLERYIAEYDAAARVAKEAAP